MALRNIIPNFLAIYLKFLSSFLKKICLNPFPRSKVCLPETSAVFLAHVSACVSKSPANEPLKRKKKTMSLIMQ